MKTVTFQSKNVTISKTNNNPTCFEIGKEGLDIFPKQE